MKSPRLKNAAGSVAKTLLLGALMLGAATVMAQSNSAQQAITGGINFANIIAKLLVALFALGGLGAIGAGVFMIVKKGTDRGDDIEWSKIGYRIVGGAMALAIGYIAYSMVDAIGGNRNEIGNAVTVGRP